jgi:hypothetical protein
VVIALLLVLAAGCARASVPSRRLPCTQKSCTCSGRKTHVWSALCTALRAWWRGLPAAARTAGGGCSRGRRGGAAGRLAELDERAGFAGASTAAGQVQVHTPRVAHLAEQGSLQPCVVLCSPLPSLSGELPCSRADPIAPAVTFVALHASLMPCVDSFCPPARPPHGACGGCWHPAPSRSAPRARAPCAPWWTFWGRRRRRRCRYRGCRRRHPQRKRTPCWLRSRLPQL